MQNLNLQMKTNKQNYMTVFGRKYTEPEKYKNKTKNSKYFFSKKVDLDSEKADNYSIYMKSISKKESMGNIFPIRFNLVEHFPMFLKSFFDNNSGAVRNNLKIDTSRYGCVQINNLRIF